MKTIIALLLFQGIVWADCKGQIVGFSQDQSGNAIINFLIINGTQTFAVDDHVPFGADGTQPGEFVSEKCSGLQTQSIGFSSATAVGQIILPFSTSPSVNLFAIQENQLTNNLKLLRQYKEMLSYGVITSTDTNYQAILSSVTTEFATIEATATTAGLIPLAP